MLLEIQRLPSHIHVLLDLCGLSTIILMIAQILTSPLHIIMVTMAAGLIFSSTVLFNCKTIQVVINLDYDHLVFVPMVPVYYQETTSSVQENTLNQMSGQQVDPAPPQLQGGKGPDQAQEEVLTIEEGGVQ